MQDTLVVKFGGSSATSPDLSRWVAAIERATMPVVVVPGGGPFADTVRRYQPRMGFDDEAAHEMAILAMEQFGCALVSLGRRMIKAANPDEIEACLARGDIPVWMPFDVVVAAPDIEWNWTVTSDSLAAWLAARLKAARLCLVKQIDMPPDLTLDALSGARIVDESFPRFLDPQTEIFVAGPSDLAVAGSRFAEGVTPGRRVVRRGHAAATPAE